MTFSPKAIEREENAWVPGCLSSLRIKFICFSSFFCSCLLIACRSDSFPRCVAVVFDQETSTRPKDNTNLAIYGCLVCATFVFTIIRSQAFLLASLKCSERLHDKMVVSVLQAPVLFFDSNPLGRIMNRFSKDVGCLDEVLPKNFLISIQEMLAVFASILVPTVTNPWLLLAVVPMTVLFLYITRYHLKTSRELKRLESISRSPVFSHISESIDGLDTIRTRGRQTDFVEQFHRYCTHCEFFRFRFKRNYIFGRIQPIV